MKIIFRKVYVKQIVFIGSSGIILFVAIVFLLSFFHIKNVEVEPAIASVSIDSSQIPFNLVFFPSGKLRAFILEEYPRIKDVQFVKKYPDTLIVHLTMREPIAHVISPDRSLAVDSNRVLFELLENNNLPVVKLAVNEMTPGRLATGRGVDVSIAFIHALQGESIRSIELIANDTLEVTTQEGIILINPDGNGITQADTLQVLLKGFRMKGSIPRVIDLRFSKPIITP